MEPNPITTKPDLKTEPTQTNQYSDLKTIRTYASDMAKALSDQQGSVIKIAMAEHKKKESDFENISPASKKNIKLILGSILMILIGAGSVLYVFLNKKNDVVVVDKKPVIESLIVSESAEEIKIEDILTPKQFSDSILVLKEMDRNDGVLNIIFTTPTETGSRLITTEELLEKIDTDTSGYFVRALTDNYMFGLYTEKGVSEFFMVLKTTSRETSLAGMLEWENKMFDNFYGILGITPNTENNYLFSEKFSDIVIENRDARVLYNKEGEPVLVYVFIDAGSILIAESFETVNEVIDRLDASINR